MSNQEISILKVRYKVAAKVKRIADQEDKNISDIIDTALGIVYGPSWYLHITKAGAKEKVKNLREDLRIQLEIMGETDMECSKLYQKQIRLRSLYHTSTYANAEMARKAYNKALDAYREKHRNLITTKRKKEKILRELSLLQPWVKRERSASI